MNQVLSPWLIRAASAKRGGEEPGRVVGHAEREEHVHVALDGKTLRGTLGHLATDQQKRHQVGLYETRTGVFLTEHIGGAKEKERSRVSEFLVPRRVKGRIISADAFHTQHTFCPSVMAAEGDDRLFAKGNQPTFQQDLRLFFREPPLACREWREAQSVDKGHGRRETRHLVARTERHDFLSTTWTGVGHVFCLRRRVQQALICTQEFVYGLTSLTPAQASPERLLERIRGQWAIENRLHWRRDVTLRDDHCQVRKGAAPRVLAVLNRVLLGLRDLLGVTNVASQMRRFDARPLHAVQLLLGTL